MCTVYFGESEHERLFILREEWVLGGLSSELEKSASFKVFFSRISVNQRSF